MHRHLAGAGLALGLALAAGGAAAQQAEVSGKWAVSGEIVTGEAQVIARPVCDFQQAGAKLTGSCKGPNAHGPATGSVAGQKVSWTWELTADTAIGANGTGRFEGELGADHVIRGTWSFSGLPGASGKFTGEKR
jgi:hypothetical protein